MDSVHIEKVSRKRRENMKGVLKLLSETHFVRVRSFVLISSPLGPKSFAAKSMMKFGKKFSSNLIILNLEKKTNSQFSYFLEKIIISNFPDFPET